MSDEKKLLNLDPIKAREGAATSGPWEVSFGQNDDLPKYAYADTVTGDRVSLNTSVSDALFIAHAREDVPALVVEVEALRAELDAALAANKMLDEGGRRLDCDLTILRGRNARLEKVVTAARARFEVWTRETYAALDTALAELDAAKK